MEKKQLCGSDGYWLGYGYHFCQKFLKDHETFSAPLQSWLVDVRYCLQEEAVKIDERLSCSRTHEAALHSHVDCYVDTGFCRLSYADQLVVYWYLKSAIKSKWTWIEAGNLIKACQEAR